MNTRKVFFGLLGVAFLAMTAVSTTVISDDTLDNGTTQIDKRNVKNQ